MRPRELGELMLRKAKEDQFTVEKLTPDPASPDAVIGFHAQQAVEKMLKGVLALHAVRYIPTHNLLKLLDLLNENRISFPEGFKEVGRLTPFAATFRYADMAEPLPGSFDRSLTLKWVRQVRSWAEAVLREQSDR